ncbi:MAG TPA: TIGR03621 family F420-dependent LLM class oxidoreductase [Chloroflexota bacterium]|nr:TIGR03621 family F420-dependent LLM class oxidoreductase [Chloroflexota bacterium]
MNTTRPFRFGVVAAQARSGDDWQAKARRVEALGYATLVVPDGLRYILAPLPALAVAAAATQTLRVGTYVIDNDFRNPVLLAKDAATIDFLSNGRFELGLGAGRPDAAEDNQLLGIPFESGAARLARLAAALQAIKNAWSESSPLSPRPAQRPRPPILVAASGKQMLALAAREADIIALGTAPTATEDDVLQKIVLIREAAGQRFDGIELNLNLMAVADQVPQHISRRMNLTAQALADAGAASAVVGTTEQMCETLQARRERLGVSYIMVADELMEAFAPVVQRLSGH